MDYNVGAGCKLYVRRSRAIRVKRLTNVQRLRAHTRKEKSTKLGSRVPVALVDTLVEEQLINTVNMEVDYNNNNES